MDRNGEDERTNGNTSELSVASDSIPETPVTAKYRPSDITLLGRSSDDEDGSEASDNDSTQAPKNGFFSPTSDVHESRDSESEQRPEGYENSVEDQESENNEEGADDGSATPTIHAVEQESQEVIRDDTSEDTTENDGSERTDTEEPQEDQKPMETPQVEAPRASSISSMVFVATALEKIAATKEARRKKELNDGVQFALKAIKEDKPIAPEDVFEPLRLATETTNSDLTTTSLDCIGKLITYSYFSLAPAPQSSDDLSKPQPPLIERAIDTICECFQDEATPADVQLQIVKSLLAAVLNDKIVVHGAGLLKAVRQVYNIFLLSKTSASQQIAQGTLTQMVGTVFERVKSRLARKEARIGVGKLSSDRATTSGSQVDLNGNIVVTGPDGIPETDDGEGDADATSESASTAPSELPLPNEKMTLQSFENSKNFDDTRIGDNAPTMVTRAQALQRLQQSPGQTDGTDEHAVEDEEDEIYVKDAFLVFRSMCRLSTKVLAQEQLQDLRSQNMRSKLISLSIIRMLMNNNTDVFTSPLVTIRGNANEATSFGQAINQYLRLALSRNGASSVKQVFEVSCEIFWLMLKDMRVMLKREIEVFMKEIYLSILERRNAPPFQKIYIMKILRRLGSEPKALVEMYLNYDCDRSALDNMFQKTIELLSKISSTPSTATAQQQQLYQEQHSKDADHDEDWKEHGKIPPPLTTASLANAAVPESDFPIDFVMKQMALDCLLRTLRSLLDWSQTTIDDTPLGKSVPPSSKGSFEEIRGSLERAQIGGSSPRPSALETPGPSTPLVEDDPSQFEKAKQRKTALSNGVRLFNFKAKKGVKQLIKDGFIASASPQDIATFILQTETLDKSMVGEYLGEGEEENIAIMHAFVDTMEFANRRFVDSLRQFLQSFRLPGEAQKIDRFMLKFAERYITGNPKAFANADTAYILAYSVVLLNTDQHSTRMKGPRMTPEDFIKNNRGINDGKDLPDDYLVSIYEEIASNEIVLTSEREHAAALGITAQPATSGLGLFAKDTSREMAHQADQEMSNKAEQRLRSLLRAQRRLAVTRGTPAYIPATSFKHVGPMFDVVWMSFLSGFSGPMQTTQNLETIKFCMHGIKLAIKITCMFDLDTARTAFVTFLANCTNLGNPREMIAKNVEALKILLDIALTDGNALKGSWQEILTCISQLDRFQLISGGVDEDIVPDVRKVSTVHASRPQTGRRTQSKRTKDGPNKQNSFYQAELTQELRSTEMNKTVDKIFTKTAELSGESVVYFVKALSDVSWQEIQSSGHSDSPRMYSLQKVVEISYYNMTRVRFEWTNIWQVLGDHFNQVGCHNNTNVVFFALDSLRQLSMRFMEIGELPGFKFQKDFLKPFEHVMANSTTVTVKDMVLRCLIQMIQAQGDNIRSGWKTMFGTFTVAAKEPYESIVSLSMDHVAQIYNSRFGVIIAQGAFPDLVVCLTEYSKNQKFQKKSLQAIETLKSTVPRMLRTPECPLAHKDEEPQKSQPHENVVVSRFADRLTQEEQFWFPVLFAFHDVLMTGEDLEVRSQALNYLFDTLIKYGGGFPPSFWDTLWRQLLYPIFMVLKSKSEMSKAANHEDLSFWLSTTMIQALRNMMALFTHYFDSLEYMLDRFLDLLALCICQENDTIARIGSNCLQTLILQNVTKFKEQHWHQIVNSFVALFDRTTAHQLFTAATSTTSTANISEDEEGPGANSRDTSISNDEPTSPSTTGSHSDEPSSAAVNGLEIDTDHAQQEGGLEDQKTPTIAEPELENFRPQSQQQQQPVVVTAARRRFFNKIITRCFLQLLIIETVNELFSNNDVYAQIPSPELLRLMTMLKKSYQFAKKFNNDKELRMRLWQEGFMKQPPNLLKQESGSAATYVSILVRMYFDEGEERRTNRPQTEAALIPLCADIIRGYAQLDEESQGRNISAWRPVVVDVLEAYTNFPSADFEKHIQTFYPLGVELLSRDMNAEVRLALQGFLRRVGEARMGMTPQTTSVPTPTSPRSSFGYFSRRRSSVRSMGGGR